MTDIDDIPEKECSRCDESWPATTEYFSRCSKMPDGLHSWCKACQTEAKRDALPPRPAPPMPDLFRLQLGGRA